MILHPRKEGPLNFADQEVRGVVVNPWPASCF